jgi:ABC-type maltose transport system permease subunit
MSDIEEVIEVDSSSRRTALVALLLMLLGAIIATIGVALTFGIPIGLVVLGSLLLSGGISLGLMS